MTGGEGRRRSGSIQRIGMWSTTAGEIELSADIDVITCPQGLWFHNHNARWGNPFDDFGANSVARVVLVDRRRRLHEIVISPMSMATINGADLGSPSPWDAGSRLRKRQAATGTSRDVDQSARLIASAQS